MPFDMMKPDQRARLKPCLRCGYSLRFAPRQYRAWPWTVATLVYVPWATVMLGYGGTLLRSAAREADRNWVSDP